MDEFEMKVEGAGHHARIPKGFRRDPPTHDPAAGRHDWVAMATYLLRDPGEQQSYLDDENLLFVDVICWHCEQPFSPELKARRCLGDPTD